MIVGEEGLRVSGRFELPNKPTRVKQQRVEALALIRLREVMREVQVIVTLRPRITLPTPGAVERLNELLVQRDEALIARLIEQKVADRVVQAEEALSQVEVEQERSIEEPAEQIFRLEVIEIARRHPQARNDPDGDVDVLRKYAEFAEAQAFRLGQEFDADADGARDSLGAVGRVARIEGDKTLGVEPFVHARDGFRRRRALTTRSRRNPLTIFSNCAHSPRRSASLARLAPSRET